MSSAELVNYGLIGGEASSRDEEVVYRETLSYLEAVEAGKIYAVNPIFPALSRAPDTVLNFDTFGMLVLPNSTPGELLGEVEEEGAGYIVVDLWARAYEPVIRMVKEIEASSRLIKVIAPDSVNRVEIYALGVSLEGVFNGGFERTIRWQGREIPMGWEVITLEEGEDAAIVKPAEAGGTRCLALGVYEDGRADAAYAAVTQRAGSGRTLVIKTYQQEDTRLIGEHVLGPYILLFDSAGNSLYIGFSEDGGGLSRLSEKEAVFLGTATTGGWAEHTLDLGALWEETGWVKGDEMVITIANRATPGKAGASLFYIAGVELLP